MGLGIGCLHRQRAGTAAPLYWRRYQGALQARYQGALAAGPPTHPGAIPGGAASGTSNTSRRDTRGRCRRDTRGRCRRDLYQGALQATYQGALPAGSPTQCRREVLGDPRRKRMAGSVVSISALCLSLSRLGRHCSFRFLCETTQSPTTCTIQ